MEWATWRNLPPLVPAEDDVWFERFEGVLVRGSPDRK